MAGLSFNIVRMVPSTFFSRMDQLQRSIWFTDMQMPDKISVNRHVVLLVQQL